MDFETWLNRYPPYLMMKDKGWTAQERECVCLMLKEAWIAALSQDVAGVVDLTDLADELAYVDGITVCGIGQAIKVFQNRIANAKPPAPAPVAVELLRKFAALPIDDYYASLNTPHVVTLIREARKILWKRKVFSFLAPDSAAEQALGKLRDKAHPHGYPESAPVAPVAGSTYPPRPGRSEG